MPAARRLDMDDDGLGDTLLCSRCHSYTCQHVGQARELIRRELHQFGLLAPVEAAERTRDRVLRLSERTPETPPSEAGSSSSAEISFRDNPIAFRDAARHGARDGVPFYAEAPALRGLAAGVRFGVELEFGGARPDLVAAGLFEAGIIPEQRMRGYHYAQNTVGWAQWSLESDCTVAGELVSRILSDDQESWQQLEQACRVIRDRQGTTHNAGSHTNISCPDFTTEHAWRLAHLVRAHEQDLDRMGRTRGSARELGYASPLPDPGPHAWTRHPYEFSGHGMVNLSDAFRTRDRSRIEFRFPDASHDPGVIQAQVMLCASMTNYVRDHEVPIGQHVRRGSALAEGWGARATSGPLEEFAEHTVGVRGLIDDLASTDRDRHQLACLWGRGNFSRR